MDVRDTICSTVALWFFSLLLTVYIARCYIIFECRLLCWGGLGIFLLQIHPGRILVGCGYHDHRRLRGYEVFPAKCNLDDKPQSARTKNLYTSSIFYYFLTSQQTCSPSLIYFLSYYFQFVVFPLESFCFSFVFLIFYCKNKIICRQPDVSSLLLHSSFSLFGSIHLSSKCWLCRCFSIAEHTAARASVSNLFVVSCFIRRPHNTEVSSSFSCSISLSLCSTLLYSSHPLYYKPNPYYMIPAKKGNKNLVCLASSFFIKLINIK